MYGQVKVRVEGLQTDVAHVIHTLQSAYAVLSLTEQQILTGAGDKAVVYQYITVKVDYSVKPATHRSDRP